MKKNGFAPHHSVRNDGSPKNGAGFTLIEILIVIGIFGILAFIGSNMFFTILKSSAKTRVLAEVKQNGSYALSVMGRMIRNAKRIESYSDSLVTIVNPDDGTTTFRCCGSSPDFLIASESGGLTCENARLTNDKVRVGDCSAVFSVVEGEEGVNPDVVTIDFTLWQAGVVVRPEEEATVAFKTTVSLRTY